MIGQSQKIGGRTLGGGIGFGLLGMGWSLYSTLIARGSEVEFRKNAVVEPR